MRAPRAVASHRQTQRVRAPRRPHRCWPPLSRGAGVVHPPPLRTPSLAPVPPSAARPPDVDRVAWSAGGATGGRRWRRTAGRAGETNRRAAVCLLFVFARPVGAAGGADVVLGRPSGVVVFFLVLFRFGLGGSGGWWWWQSCWPLFLFLFLSIVLSSCGWEEGGVPAAGALSARAAACWLWAWWVLCGAAGPSRAWRWRAPPRRAGPRGVGWRSRAPAAACRDAAAWPLPGARAARARPRGAYGVAPPADVVGAEAFLGRRPRVPPACCSSGCRGLFFGGWPTAVGRLLRPSFYPDCPTHPLTAPPAPSGPAACTRPR